MMKTATFHVLEYSTTCPYCDYDIDVFPDSKHLIKGKRIKCSNCKGVFYSGGTE